jgi:short subunit dehydrogenase-like uncharacterized protein
LLSFFYIFPFFKNSMQNREYDLIIWGATGFTGQLVVEYLNQNYASSSLKWAIAGRDAGKLSEIRDKYGLNNIPLLTADSFDLESLKKLTAQAKVICSTVGPYSLYGNALLQACVEESAHYCDLTGEVPWMRKTIDRHHEQAKAKKLKLVHTCGFDCIPSDLGVMEVQRRFFEKYGYYAQEVRTRVAWLKGGLSGGTYASMNHLMDESKKDPSIGKTIANPYAINPQPEYPGKDKKDLQTVKKDEQTGHWLAPFIMASVNTRVVRRSHALQEFPYGPDFTYEEAMNCGKGITGRIKATGILAGLGVLMAAKPGSFIKKIIDSRMPKPGEGPDAATREAGGFKLLIYAQGKGSDQVVLAVKGDRDPGYGSTSKMLAESAICLTEEDKLPTTFGMLTPAVAMGDVLLKRLEHNAGLSFTLVD